MLNDMNVVGQWYQRPDTREIFQVIDWDDRSDAVRVQMFDGSLDELETDSWRSLSPEPVAAPKDCTGPLDNVEPDEGDEWGEESNVMAEEESFIDAREPWEILMVEEDIGS